MNNKSKTENSVINSSVALVMRVLYLGVTFLTRTEFIRALGVDYLGINGLFTNILSMLSLSELGLGGAILFALYSKITTKDEFGISSLIIYYEKVYRLIGVVVVVLGLLVMPFIRYINGMQAMDLNIYWVYILFLSNSVVTYFFASKPVMLEADQQSFVSSIIHYSIMTLTNIFQIFVLFVTHNYYLFLLLLIAFNFLENIVKVQVVNRKYSFIKRYRQAKIDRVDKSNIIGNTKSLFVHRLSGFIVFGTDNLLIALLVNLREVGFYNDYYLIISNLTLITGGVLNGVRSSVGNLVATGKVESAYSTFQLLQYVCFLIYAFCTASLFVLIQPFIRVWLGNGFVLPRTLVIILLINFYLTGMRTVVLVFKDANGYFRQDVTKAIVEAGINSIASIGLGKLMGLQGIFLGTLVSSLLTSFWFEPYLVFKLYFKNGFLKYWFDYCRHVVFVVVASGIGYVLYQLISTRIDFVFSALLTMIVIVFVLVALTFNSREFSQLVDRIRRLSVARPIHSP